MDPDAQPGFVAAAVERMPLGSFKVLERTGGKP